MLNTIKGFLGSKKAWAVVSYAAVTAAYVFAGYMEVQAWFDYMQPIMLAYLGAEGLQVGLAKLGEGMAKRK